MRVAYNFYLNDDSSALGRPANTLSLFIHRGRELDRYEERDLPGDAVYIITKALLEAGFEFTPNTNGCIGWTAYKVVKLSEVQ